jgi:hypothetical protein
VAFAWFGEPHQASADFNVDRFGMRSLAQQRQAGLPTGHSIPVVPNP